MASYVQWGMIYVVDFMSANVFEIDLRFFPARPGLLGGSAVGALWLMTSRCGAGARSLRRVCAR
ncbi:MAG: hypothetical protein JRG92_10830 [Deltaproteobacteria bacterium]|nr:hypothetical protein [Deltaproteobacteria bacterium]MBW2384120.1 hypothetical protein [Deltaproteobacteria bacterium]MBW2695586.1 hypothetical protein [Deltaproteobacteria bacterium]